MSHNRRLWTLEDPYLYRVTSHVTVAESPSFDEKSTRCGFRDFRFEKDAFRLNGQRIYLQGALILPHYPVGFRLPPREDYLRRDLLAWKAMGLNTCRIIWVGCAAATWMSSMNWESWSSRNTTVRSQWPTRRRCPADSTDPSRA